MNNKKGILKIVVKICLSAVLMFNLTGVNVSADSGENVLQKGEWRYFDRGEYIAVCGYTGNDEHITIPSEIDGKEVREVICEAEAKPFFEQAEEDYEYKFVNFLKRVTFPDTVQRIGKYVFYNCTGLEQADLPQGLVVIEDSAFEYTPELSKADIPDSVKVIGDRAFEDSMISEINLPEGLEYIGERAFYRTAVEIVEIPETLKHLGKSAFSYCYALEKVKLTANIQFLPDYLFECCRQLKTVEIPEGVLNIGERTFDECTSLEEIYLPSTVNFFNDILGDNTSLRDIYFAADRETVSFAKDRSAGQIYEEYRYRGEPDLDAEVKHAMKSDFERVMEFYNRESDFPNIKDYSSIKIHYGEKAEIPEEKSLEERIRDIFLLLTAVFVITFMIFLTLYLVKKRQNEPYLKAETQKQTVSQPSAAPLSQDSVLIKPRSDDGIRCKNCGAESGKKAEYCYNCGKRLSAKK